MPQRLSSAHQHKVWGATLRTSNLLCASVIFFASACSVTSLWPGLPKDLWELSQMLGRGGRDGSQAAFVSLVWVGQAGRLLLHAKFFVSFQSLQVVEVLARLWAGCSWSRRWNDRPARGLPWGGFSKWRISTVSFWQKNIITCFNRVLLIGGGGCVVQRGVPGSWEMRLQPLQVLPQLWQQMQVRLCQHWGWWFAGQNFAARNLRRLPVSPTNW